MTDHKLEAADSLAIAVEAFLKEYGDDNYGHKSSPLIRELYRRLADYDTANDRDICRGSEDKP